jgi:hypothetical protein
MTDEDGGSRGWHATERDAKDALTNAAVKELGK